MINIEQQTMEWRLQTGRGLEHGRVGGEGGSEPVGILQ